MEEKDVKAIVPFEKAMALLSLGIPPYCVNGMPLKPGGCWEYRVISTSDIEEAGLETIEDAEEQGIEGNIAYGFGPHPQRDKIIKAFDTAWEEAWSNKDTEIPDTICIIDAKSGKKKEVLATELMAMAIAFAFRNADKFFPRRTEVRAKLKLEKSETSFAIVDRQSPQEVIDYVSQ